LVTLAAALVGGVIGWALARMTPNASGPLHQDDGPAISRSEAEHPDAEPEQGPLVAERTETPKAQTSVSPDQAERSARNPSAAPGTVVVDVDRGTVPSPHGSPRQVLLRSPDGELVEVELRKAQPYIDPNAYPPPNSVLEGTQLTVLHSNGAVAEVGEFDGKHRVGHWSFWSEDGRLIMEGEFASGLAQGLWRAWHDNGRPAGETGTKAGEFHGECRFWRADGSFDSQRSGWYEMGVRAGDL
jgi:hypothetical protein